nr:MAG TPA: hypothetical protein [Caudoviricetes sp.]
MDLYWLYILSCKAVKHRGTTKSHTQLLSLHSNENIEERR